MKNDLSADEKAALLEDALARYYAAIGRIASVWAMLELRMDQLIWDMVDVEQKLGACLTAHLRGPSDRVRVIKTVLELREWPADILAEFNKFGRKLIPLQEKRNRAVHDTWFVGVTSKNIFKKTVTVLDNKLVFEDARPTLEELDLTFRDSRKQLEHFNILQTTIRQSVPSASPELLLKLTTRVGHQNDGRLSLRRTFPDRIIPSKQ